MTRLALLVFIVGACGGGAPRSATTPAGGEAASGTEVADPIPKTKGPDCAIVADRLATVAHAETPDRQTEARDTFRTRCADDKWGDEARSCFATVETDDEIGGCAKLLTDAQRAQLELGSPDLPKAPATGTPAPDGASAPGGKDKGSSGTRGGGTRQRNSSDPCEGGE